MCLGSLFLTVQLHAVPDCVENILGIFLLGESFLFFRGAPATDPIFPSYQLPSEDLTAPLDCLHRRYPCGRVLSDFPRSQKFFSATFPFGRSSGLRALPLSEISLTAVMKLLSHFKDFPATPFPNGSPIEVFIICSSPPLCAGICEEFSRSFVFPPRSEKAFFYPTLGPMGTTC